MLALLAAPSISEENMAPFYLRTSWVAVASFGNLVPWPDWVQNNSTAAERFLRPLLTNTIFRLPGATRGVSEL